MLHQREQRELKAIWKATEAAREAYEGLTFAAHQAQCAMRGNYSHAQEYDEKTPMETPRITGWMCANDHQL